MSADKRGVTAIRWIARAWSVASVGFVLLMFVGSLLAFYAALRIMGGRFPGGPYFALVAAPGILFLVCWLLSRGVRKE